MNTGIGLEGSVIVELSWPRVMLLKLSFLDVVSTPDNLINRIEISCYKPSYIQLDSVDLEQHYVIETAQCTQSEATLEFRGGGKIFVRCADINVIRTA